MILTKKFGVMGITLTVLASGGCGKSNGKTQNATDTDTTASTSTADDDPDTTTATVAAKPAASDLGTNLQTQGQLAADGLNSATMAAAAGTSGASSAASLTLGNGDANPLQPVKSSKAATTTADCYAGSTLQSRTGASLSWPESTDANSVFANSKNDATTTTNMYVEPALLQYPTTNPTKTLTLAAPFAFANMVEVIFKSTGESQVVLNDKAQTSVSESGSNEEHRFWVAKSGALTCGPANGAKAKGSSGSANGSWAKIDWKTDTAINGLSLLQRYSRTGSQAKSFLPKVKGQLAAAANTVNSTVGASGYRLVQWTTSTAKAADISGAAVVRQKTITHVASRTLQLLDGKNAVTSDLNHTEEIRASDPLVVQEYRASDESAVAHVISSGTIYKTGKDSSGTVKWFSTLSYNAVKFDLANSSEPCLPVSGTVTMTTYDKEGGTKIRQITITYSSATGDFPGKVDPTITVTGADDNSTAAKWMMLHTNRKCDLR